MSLMYCAVKLNSGVEMKFYVGYSSVYWFDTVFVDLRLP
jgi:hypothetical protein